MFENSSFEIKIVHFELGINPRNFVEPRFYKRGLIFEIGLMMSEVVFLQHISDSKSDS